VRRAPAVERAVVPGDIDKDETGNTDQRASPVKARGKSRTLAQFPWHDHERECSKGPANDSKAPEGPWPPDELSENTAKSGAGSEAGRSNCAEDAEYDVLLDAGRVGAAEKSETVGHDQCGSHTLHRAADVEEDLTTCICRETGERGPDTEPGISKRKHPLMSKNVPHPTGNENEGTDSERIAGEKPS
jgi:hypothetical protein